MKDDNERDNELDNLLKPLKAAAPNDLQLQKWKDSILKENRKSSVTPSHTNFKFILQLTAAMFIGVIIGAIAFNNPLFEQSKIIAQVSLDDATFERSHTNLD